VNPQRALPPILLVLLSMLLASVPGSTVAQIHWIEAPEFAPPATGYNPGSGDLDGDLDPDLIYGVTLQSYRNIGTASVPSWQQDNSLIQGVEYVSCMTTCLADLDADGDLDLSVGFLNAEAHALNYYENVGTSGEPTWRRDYNMYESLPPGAWTCPDLADLDGDGDLDLVLAVEWGLRAYRNTGTPGAPIWDRDDSLIEGMWLPHGYVDPTLGDLDGDADLDALLGSRYFDSPIVCFENVGTVQAPSWVENESLLTGVDRFVNGLGLDLADIDADADLDLLVIDGWGSTFYLNCGAITPVEPSSWGRIKGLFRQQ
jgi:hypothetical protein